MPCLQADPHPRPALLLPFPSLFPTPLVIALGKFSQLSLQLHPLSFPTSLHPSLPSSHCWNQPLWPAPPWLSR